ncbi:RHS domain-containing protein [Muribacter muris]|uniref:RHS domain-containing protein n=1 Tax=Muribacter muris TaxID=67855 RepID=UPI00069D83F1|nr:RHS domain-containing protein [Muribacter muris]
MTTRYALDPVGKLTAQLNAQITRHYQYDNAGNLIQSRDNLTQTTHYGYDKLGRLTQAKSPLSQETFAFDPAHNIIEREGQREQDNKVNQYHGTHYRYDGLGNLVERKLASGETQYYRYDLNDQLIEAKIIKANGREDVWHYRYDPLGRRLNKRSAMHENLQTDFVWDGSHLIQEQSGENRYTYIYTHPESYEPLAQIQVVKNGEKQTAYYHCDQIGIPRELTDQQGNLLWHANYKGWGELQGEHNLKSVHQPLRLQNQYGAE